MSSKDYQVVKRMRKVQLNPQTSGGDAVNFSAKVKTIGSTRTGGNDRFAITQGASSSISGRELNLDALTQVRDRNQLPARGGASGESQTTNVSRTVQRFGFGSSGSGSGNQDSRMGGMTFQAGSRFGAGASGSGSGAGLSSQAGSRFGAGASGSGSGAGMSLQAGARFGAGASGSGSGAGLTQQGGSRFGAGASGSGSGLTQQGGSRFGTGASGSGEQD